MGYYTRYSLSIGIDENDLILGLDIPKTSEDLIAELRESLDDAAYALDENGNVDGDCKWYDHEDDLKSFSKKYPNALFTLSGEGEESGDIWKKYFKDGKVQRANAVITFEKFDPKKLK
jgi:hypothetical protein